MQLLCGLRRGWLQVSMVICRLHLERLGLGVLCWRGLSCGGLQGHMLQLCVL